MRKLRDKNPNNLRMWEDYYFSKKNLRTNMWLFEYIKPYLKKSQNIIEVGCGLGGFLNKLSKVFTDKTFVGTDYSKVAIKRCNQKRRFNTSFKIMDINKPVPNDFKKVFDMSLCIETLEHLDNPELAVKNCIELVKDNGVAVFTVPRADSPLDTNKINAHYNTIYPEDFKKWLGNIKYFHDENNHLIIIKEVKNDS